MELYAYNSCVPTPLDTRVVGCKTVPNMQQLEIIVIQSNTYQITFACNNLISTPKMKKQIIKWTEEEKDKLVQQVQINTQNNRTSWNKVALVMNRTPNQCKTYYTIVIKHLESKQVNVKWNIGDYIRLITTVSIYGKKWELIRKLEFNEYTAEQLRQKYIFFENKKSFRVNLLQIIQQNEEIPLEKVPSIFKENIEYLSVCSMALRTTSTILIQNQQKKLSI
ncbi:Conserved_hypothetical protein [Hexamita inflata]|uniref:Myb-like DNA-binding domain-containing protein n=1 Tax=Hexamita inflata TaxID=28002 RepID=A0ABP1GEA7_9EUKA